MNWVENNQFLRFVCIGVLLFEQRADIKRIL